MGHVARLTLMASAAIMTTATASAAICYQITGLGTLYDTNSRAYGVNDAGQVVGAGGTLGGSTHAFTNPAWLHITCSASRWAAKMSA